MKIYPGVTALNFIFGALLLLYLPLQIRARNIGLTFFILWVSGLCIGYGANTVVWRDNALNSAPIWCEISIRASVGGLIAVASCSLSIVRQLYYTVSPRRVVMSQKQLRWQLFIDYFLCIGLPILYIALLYVVQDHRFDIFEEMGCVPAVYNTPLTIVLVYMWPLLLGVISVIYSGIIIYTLLRNRSSFIKRLKSEHPEINYVLFCRIFALTLVDAVLTIPFSVTFIYFNTTIVPIHPYISWVDTHSNYSRVISVPSVLWRYGYETDPTGGWFRFAIVWRNIMNPACALIFLAIYGTSMDIVWYYWDVIWRCLAWFGLKRSTRTIVRDVERFHTHGPVFSSVVYNDDAILAAVEYMESSFHEKRRDIAGSNKDLTPLQWTSGTTRDVSQTVV